MVIGQLLERSANLYPDKIAIIFEKNRITYKEFNERTNKLANGLLDLGVRHQERIGILCHNCNNYLEIVFACGKIGAISTHLNWRLSPKELGILIEDSEARIVFFSSRFGEVYHLLKQRLGHEIRFISIDNELEGAMDYEALIRNYPIAGAFKDVKEQEVLQQIYTSGTTGNPKGAMLTHRSMISHSLTHVLETEWSKKEKFLNVLPFFHAGGLAAAYDNTMVGSTMVIQDRFKPEAYLSAIEKEKITRIGVTPTILAFLLNYPDLGKFDLSSLSTIVYGGSPISVEVLKRSIKYFKCNFFQLYGMTEMGPEICVLYPDDHILEGPDYKVKRLASVGRPKLGVWVKVIDEDGKDCAPYTKGEIIARGVQRMQGYHKMPEATAEAIKNEWYYTGDLGYFDLDGYLYVVDRKTDMIISGGENIYPKEIEECIKQLDDVIEVAVVGVPDEKWGESVKAIVVKKPGSSLSEEEVIKHCLGSIARYKRPKTVDFVESLPVNAMGKVLKGILRKKVRDDKERSI